MNTTAQMAFGSHLNQFVGIERLLKDMERVSSDYQLSNKYPPHNIIKYNDNEYVVELAVAGFSREELEITVEDCVLIATIKEQGEKQLKEFQESEAAELPESAEDSE